MKYVVLGLLLLRPDTLYGLRKQFETSVSLFYRASFGSLTSALKGLVGAGLIERRESSGEGRRKVVYSVTASGRGVFLEWLGAIPDETDVETGILARLFFLGLVDGDVRPGILDRFSELYEAKAAQLAGIAGVIDSARIPAELADILRFQRLVLEQGMTHYAGTGRWFADLAARERAAGG